MKRWVRAFFMALGMFTALPCPYRPWDKENRGRMLVCLPFVGALIGALWFALALLGRRLLPGISHSLNALCDHYGIALDHHQADSDSHACAELLLRYFAAGASERDFIRTYRLV